MERKNYLVKEKTHVDLMMYKYRNNLKNVDQTISHLLEVANNV